MKRLRRGMRLPLHVRFARGYQFGLLVGLLVGFAVWYATQSGLDRVSADNAGARDAHALVEQTLGVADTLGRIDDDATSLVLRSELSRRLAALDHVWTRVVSEDQVPDDVAVLLDRQEGLVADFDALVADATRLAEGGTKGSAGLRPDDAATASSLEVVASSVAARLTSIAQSYDAQAEATIGGVRTLAHVIFAFSVVFLTLLVGALLRPLKEQLKSESEALREANAAHKAQARRQELATHLSEGLEAAETESETHEVVERAFAKLVPEHAVELLLGADGEDALHAEVVHPVHGGPGCGVESPWSCPAVRRGRTMTYDDSRAINACPHLAERDGPACAATCVPVSFMGRAMGVVHATRPAGVTLDREQSHVLALIATQVSIRLGTLRSFAKVELQASTDPLTGLPNRRATEDRLRRLVASAEGGAVAMADLDRFKLLNDRHGHEAGDRALRMFADAVRGALRSDDWMGRWGGEEFLIILPGLDVTEAAEALDRVREELAAACVRAEAPAVTVSMGVVDTTAAPEADEMVRLADDALLVAKAQGRDRVVRGPAMAPIASTLGVAGTVDGEDG